MYPKPYSIYLRGTTIVADDDPTESLDSPFLWRQGQEVIR